MRSIRPLSILSALISHRVLLLLLLNQFPNIAIEQVLYSCVVIIRAYFAGFDYNLISQLLLHANLLYGFLELIILLLAHRLPPLPILVTRVSADIGTVPAAAAASLASARLAVGGRAIAG